MHKSTGTSILSVTPIFHLYVSQTRGDAFVEHPVVFLCMNVLGTVWLFFGVDLMRKGLTGDSRTGDEGVLMTYLPDLVSGLMLIVLGICFWLGSFVWF